MKLRIICHLHLFYLYVVTDKKGSQMTNNSEFHVLLLTNSDVKSVPEYGWMKGLKFKNSSFNVSSIVFMYSVCLSLGRILISDLVVADLFMHSLSGMILLYLAVPFFTLKVFLHKILFYLSK